MDGHRARHGRLSFPDKTTATVLGNDQKINKIAVATDKIFRVFNTMSGLGLVDQGPEQFYSYPKGGQSGMEFFSPKFNRSFHIGVHDAPVDRRVLIGLPSFSKKGGLMGSVGKGMTSRENRQPNPVRPRIER